MGRERALWLSGEALGGDGWVGFASRGRGKGGICHRCGDQCGLGVALLW